MRPPPFSDRGFRLRFKGAGTHVSQMERTVASLVEHRGFPRLRIQCNAALGVRTGLYGQTAGRRPTAEAGYRKPLMNGAPPIRIFLADDHVILRTGVRKLIEDEPDLVVVGEASDGEGALDGVRALGGVAGVDVMVLDIAMPNLNGLEALRRMSREFRGVSVLILTMHSSETYLFQAIQAGGAGYVLKHAEPEVILMAIRDVARGHTFVSPAVEQRLLSDFVQRARRAGARAQAALQALTEREREVLGLIAVGHTNTEIGSKLFVTVKTVETHRAHIMSKLGLRSRAELVKYALREGYLTSADAEKSDGQ